jgi:hypothetical protein
MRSIYPLLKNAGAFSKLPLQQGEVFKILPSWRGGGAAHVLFMAATEG